MGNPRRQTLAVTNLRGRDGSTTATSQIPQHKCLEALNVDFFNASFARKRGGAITISTSGSGLTGKISAGFRHVPGADDTAAELWLVDSDGVWARYAAGAWSNPTLKDALTGNAWDVQAISLNGKLYFAYKSAVDRLHVWDPTSASVRRTGLAIVTGFTSADLGNTGAGTLSATIRYYRIRVTEQRGSATYRRSEATDAVSFTPSGTGTAVRFTFSGITAPGEGETHWEIEGSSVGASGPFYVIATVSIGTATYDDSVEPLGYSTSLTTPAAGNCTNWTSVQYLIADDNRLLGAGAWASGNPVNTVYVSPVIGTTSAVFFDDETVPTASANRYAFNEKDSGFITGLSGPSDNQIVVGKNRQSWRMFPTGNATNPYRRKPISKVIGNVKQQAMVMAEDDAGNPTAYWLSQLGPFRWGPAGMAKLVWDVQDIWSTINLGATTTVAHGLYHADKHQIWWWVAVGAENEPTTTKIVYDTKLGRVIEAGEVRDGYSLHTGESAKARCSVMFANTIGATVSRDLKPHIGQHGANARLWKCDTADTDDNGTAFQAYVDLPDRHFGGLEHRCELGHPFVLGSAGSYTLTLTFTDDYGTRSRTATISMAATGSETRVLRTVEGIETVDAYAVKIRVGDGSAIANTWTLDALGQPYLTRETVSS